MKLKSPPTIEKISEYTGTITALLLPFILVAAVWIGFEEVKEILATDIILFVSSWLIHKYYGKL